MVSTSIARRGLAAVVAVVVLAAGCGDDSADERASGDVPSTTGPSAEGCTADRVGGSVTMGVFSEAQGLDPAGAPGAGTTGGAERAAIFDTLVRYNPDTGEFEPHVAESVTPNDDFTSWTIKLRPGIKFGNGDPLTAESVKASLERHMAQQARSSVKRALVGATISTPDELTVVVTIPEPWVQFPFVLAREAGMVTNPAVVAQDPEGFGRNPVGAGVGPYELVRYTPGDSIVLRAKDDYWGGPVCIQELRFVSFPGSDATLEALKVDTIQVAFLGSPGAVARSEDEGIPGFDNLVHYAEGVLLNNGIRGSQTLTTDPRLRRAIALAIDPEQINQRVWDGKGLPTAKLVHPDSRLAYDTEGLSYDPEEAKRLVEEVKADG
ncbi:MAG TPA: ABC transporter substrate-binding protein, partial [Acidimicrobiales bacterium]